MDGPQQPDPIEVSTEPDAQQEMLDFLAGAPMAARRPRRGDLVEGQVVYVGREGIVVDIGTKSEAVVPPGEIGSFDNDPNESVEVGDTVVARVVDPEDDEGRTVLSLARAHAERGWRDLQQLFTEGGTVEGRVVEANRGGLVVGVHGVRGFVPLSQLVGSWHVSESEEPIETRLEARKGELLVLKVLELNRRRNRLILSERAADHERRQRERDQLLSELHEGEIRPGRVSNVCDFGAFVDLGGTDGLVHISELSWAPVGHPSEIVRVGEEVEVVVLGVDREKRKISLSLKRTRGQPWDTVADKYQVGQIVEARVKKLATFGAFVEIEPGVEGLIHISELSDQRIPHPRNVVTEGDVLPAKILRIEPDRHRLGLSLRQAQEEAEVEHGTSWRGGAVTYGGPAQTLGELLPEEAAALQWSGQESEESQDRLEESQDRLEESQDHLEESQDSLDEAKDREQGGG